MAYTRDKYMFSSSSYTSRPTPLTENDKVPNSFTFFLCSVLQSKCINNANIKFLFGNSLRVHCNPALEYILWTVHCDTYMWE